MSENKHKRYSVIDNKTGNVYKYTSLLWNFGWMLVFFFGVVAGIIITLCFKL
jgi:hypothetical protein